MGLCVVKDSFVCACVCNNVWVCVFRVSISIQDHDVVVMPQVRGKCHS